MKAIDIIKKIVGNEFVKVYDSNQQILFHGFAEYLVNDYDCWWNLDREVDRIWIIDGDVTISLKEKK